MSLPPSFSPGPTNPHRSAWLGAHANGLIWAVGNGLVSTTLITFLAKDYGATSFHVGLILACPHLLGVLRLVAPPLVQSWPDRKRWTIAFFLLSGLCLLLLPLLSWPGVLASQRQSLTALVALWGTWHVWMYVGLVPFLSWLGDLGPRQERATLFGVREACLIFGTIVGTLLAATIAAWWNSWHAKEEQWIALAGCAVAGGILVIASVAPLLFMPHRPRSEWLQSTPSTKEMLSALVDRRFRPLLLFNIWFSLANGITGAAVGIFPYAVLGLSAPVMLYFATYMRVGQVIGGPLAGRSLDRWGHRGAMATAQVIVACGLLFYLPATRNQWWWIAGAWTCWIAYAVLNVGLPSLTLRLSPGENSPAYIAVIMAASSASFAIASVLGGWLLDALRTWSAQSSTADSSTAESSVAAIDPFAALFVVGFILRLGSAAWLLLLREGVGSDSDSESGSG